MVETMEEQIVHNSPPDEKSQHYCHLGVMSQKIGNYPGALRCFKNAIQLDPGNSEAFFRCGVIEQKIGDKRKASQYYRTALEQNPLLAEAYNNLGTILQGSKDYITAKSYFTNAVKINPDFVEAWHNLSEVCKKTGDWNGAIESMEKVFSLRRDKPVILIAIGDLLYDSGKISDALSKYQQAVEMFPEYALAHFKLGFCHAEDGRHEMATIHYNDAIRCNPDFPEPYINLAKIFELDFPEKAVSCYRKAVALKPKDAELYFCLGSVLRDLNQLQQSITVTRKALHINPSHTNAQFSLAESYLLSGDFSNGWRAYDARIVRKDCQWQYRYLGQRPMWDGKPFHGNTLLVQSEQGFGDTIQFVRFMPFVKKLGGKVIFETDKSLLGLLGGFPGIDHLRSNVAEPVNPKSFDLYIPLMSIPGRLGIDLSNIPYKTNYLRPSERKTAEFRARIDTKKISVGIVWAGSHLHKRDKLRSCSLKTFESITTIPGFRFYSLQKAITDEDRLKAQNMSITLLGDFLEEFSDTAAAIHHMDLVISVDTSVAHLAAAMGKPTWIMLHKSPDFRWLTDRTDSPWYPTAKLYRQERRGDWAGIAGLIKRDLLSLTVERRTK